MTDCAIVSRGDAIELGLTHYFTGKPCKHGHISKRFTKSKVCFECSRMHSRKYQENHKEKEAERSRKRAIREREKNRKRNREYQRKRRIEDPDGCKAKAREWRNNNRDKTLEYSRRRILNPKVRISFNMRRAMLDSIGDRKAGRPWESLVGYTIEDLVVHLESLFTHGMSWENYGVEGWHIDHIIPLAVHNFETAEDIDFKRAWALSNLQPLWASENLSKKDKIGSPFQPSLALPIPVAANDNNSEAAREPA